MKALKPSAKENKRYLLLHGKDLSKNVERSILEFVGTFGFSKAGLSWIKSNKMSAIICVNREAVDNIRASFCVFSEKIIVKKVSGTLKSLGN